MNTIPLQDVLRSRWTLEGKIPLAGVADGAVWHRARTVATGESVTLFIVRGEAALEAADAVRRAYLVEDPHLLPVRDIVVLDDPRDAEAGDSPSPGPTTVVEYPLPPAPPLAALLSKAPLHPETARSIIGEAATGLEVARRRGVRHQLIDSNRLFVDTRSGQVVVLGVGVEAAAHVGLDRSREVASFQDTAALVALLYRTLTGQSPQHDASGTVPRPSTIADTEIPEDLDLLCDLVLNESADDIPETTRELIAALEPWQSIPVTLEAYPQASHRRAAHSAGEPAPVVGAAGAGAGSPASAEPTPSSGPPNADTNSDGLESTAMMEAVSSPDADPAAPASSENVDPPARPEQTVDAGSWDHPDEDTIARPANQHAAHHSGQDHSAEDDTIARPAPSLPEGPSATGAAGAAGAVGVVGAVSAQTTSAPQEDHDARPSGGPEGASATADPGTTQEQAAAEATAAAASEESARQSSEARAIVDELHLDEKRATSPFPGRLDIDPPPRPDTAEQAPVDAHHEPVEVRAPAQEPAQDAERTAVLPVAGAGALAGGVVAGAAATGAARTEDRSPAVPATGSEVPARTSGSHWPLAPTQAPGGHGASPQQPQQSSSATAQFPGTQTPQQAPDDTQASAPTPDSPPEGEATASSPIPVAVPGRTESVAPIATDGPIVVRGRARPAYGDQPEETTSASSRSSLLRDVVSVAVDSDDPGTYAMGPRQPEERSRQSQWIIAGAVLLTIIAAVFAVTTATSGLRDRMADPLDTATAEPSPTEADTGEAPVEPTAEPTEEPELPVPEMTGVELFSQGGEEPDHTDQQDRLTDGDPGTFWSTRHYASPDYGGLQDGVGIRVNFAEPSKVTAVTVTTARNNGGTLELRAVNDDGSPGDVLATGQFAGDGEVRLEPDEPLDADKVALFIPELPPDSNESGRFRARIAEITLE
ncbi:hypothetical protein [Brachybacterium sp. FME24]|uniref:hypothetical protein n=1 Tax=Brachybacterium sp. FME24 TaxID=2742605 RepID=UPI001865ED92|nr:hypothetical protein [Brachybacterium sp. FME24]